MDPQCLESRQVWEDYHCANKKPPAEVVGGLASMWPLQEFCFEGAPSAELATTMVITNTSPFDISFKVCVASYPNNSRSRQQISQDFALNLRLGLCLFANLWRFLSFDTLLRTQKQKIDFLVEHFFPCFLCSTSSSLIHCRVESSQLGVSANCTVQVACPPRLPDNSPEALSTFWKSLDESQVNALFPRSCSLDPFRFRFPSGA